MTRTTAVTTQPATVLQGDRPKAYRPIPAPDRRAALDAALTAWARGDWFETHEQLEPAWMGTADLAERDLYQGLIKLAAAYVHGARGNAPGMAKSLAGAEARLRRVSADHESIEGIPVRRLVDDIAARHASASAAAAASGAAAAATTTDLTSDPPTLPVPEES